MDALQFLAQNRPLRSVNTLYVLAGSDRFLKRLVLERLMTLLTGGGETWGTSVYSGDSEELGEVLTEVQTPALWGGRRVIVVDDAEPFVSRYRESLEKLVGPSQSAVLILVLETWASNTRLARAMPADAVFLCEPPKPKQLAQWCVSRAQTSFEKKIAADAAELLVELVGGHLGLLEQELAKLAVYVGSRDCITLQDVDRLVARNRVQTVWEILSALERGQAGEALTILNRLIEQGQEPLAILGALSWQLRKVAQVARLVSMGVSEYQAVGRLGLQPWQRDRVVSLVRRLGSQALQIYQWLLQTDASIKGTNLSPRVALEMFLARVLPQPTQLQRPKVTA